MLDVFISYNKVDEEIAKKIGRYLEGHKIGNRKIRVFLAAWDIKPGHSIVDKINEGLERAKFFVLVLSPEALQAVWPTAERAASLLSDPSGRMGRVIPVLVKPCKVPPLLAIRNWVDLRDASKFKTEMQRMLCTVKDEPLPRGGLSRSEAVIESRNSPLRSNASEPDKIDEFLHTNLFPVTKFPSVIWVAPTMLKKKSEVYTQLGNQILPFILRENRLFTFSNLDEATNRLGLVVNQNEIKTIDIKEWLHDNDKSRWLVNLLASEVRAFCKSIGLYFDKTGKRFYGDKKIITGAKLSWTAHVRKGSRGLIIPYTKTDNETGEETTYFYRHRAVSLQFRIFANELFLQIESGWVFSTNGSTLIQGKRRSVLNTKLRSRMRNSAEFDEIRFWAWLLSDGYKITIGSSSAAVDIDLKPLSFKTACGVYGDHKLIPNVIEEPPPLVEENDPELTDAYEDLYGSIEEEGIHDV